MKNRVKFIVLLVLIASSIAFGEDTLRIMPLGDSITQASSSHYSYRYNLWKKLIDYELDFDFVGSMNTNWGGNPDWPDYKGFSFDPDNEGHWGWKADGILVYLADWLEGYSPDIVLLHIGTNDIGGGQSYSSTVAEIKQIIDVIRDKNPNVKILLAKLIPRNWTYNNIVAFNEYIYPIAEDKNLPNSPVIVVDQWTDFSYEDDTYDGTHPNESGEEKMAEKWFQGILECLRTFDSDLNHDDKIDAGDLSYIANEWTLESCGDLYLGDNFDDVNNADNSSVTFMGNFSRNSYQLENLELNKTYYWRVDERDANGLHKGDVWQFTTGDDYSNIGWWKLDGETKDLSGNDNNGEAFGDISIKDDPNWGRCYSFDGYNDYVEIANEEAFDFTDKITITAWVRFDAEEERMYTIASKGNSFWLYHDEYAEAIVFSCYGLGRVAQSSVDISDGIWHHVAATYNGVERAIYIDGIKDIAKATSGVMTLNDLPVTIGKNETYGENNQFKGMIREVRIYSEKLSDDQILWLSRTSNHSPWPFNGQDNVECNTRLTFYPEEWIRNIESDLNEDFGVDFEDFSILAKDWLETVF